MAAKPSCPLFLQAVKPGGFQQDRNNDPQSGINPAAPNLGRLCRLVVRKPARRAHMAHSVVVGACPHDCPDTCSILTTVEDGKAIAVRGNPDHPFTRGRLCVKVNNYQERVYSDKRGLYPLKRVGPKGSKQFQRISWDEAIATIATRW